MTTITTETPYFTVEQASRWLTCAQPVPLPLLQRLGKDCSMVCRIRGATFIDVPVQGKNWPTERGYPAAILQEVFLANPDTRPYVPGAATPAPVPTLTKPTTTVWVLTREVLAYDQEGAYFCAVWATKPTADDLRAVGVRDCEHVLNGGGQRPNDYEWHSLTELPA